MRAIDRLPLREVGFIQPMECVPVAKLTEGPQWIFEIKLDGYRAIAVTGQVVNLFSRRGKTFNRQYPHIVEALSGLPEGTVLDGEVVAQDDAGRPSFNMLQHSRSQSSRIRYFVFDLLVYKNRDLTRDCLSGLIWCRLAQRQTDIYFSGMSMTRLAKLRGCLMSAIALGIVFGSTAYADTCANDKEGIASLEHRIMALEEGSNPPHTSIEYHRQLQSLEDQLHALQQEVHFDCGDPGYGRGSGTLTPKYLVVGVVYAPPGAAGGKGSSSVDYGSGTSFGTTVSLSNSFKNATSITATAGVSGGVASADLSVSVSKTVSETDKSALDIKNTVKNDLKVPGPGADGIDHDEDRIYLWLNPVVTVDLTQIPTGISGTWSLDAGNGVADEQFVYVGWLKHPEKMDANVAQRLVAVGITSADYAGIMQYDPFASDISDLSSNPRFTELSTTFPYEPPYAASDPPGSETYTITNEQTKTSSSTSSTAYGFSVAVTVKVNGGFASASLAVKDEMTWTAEKSSQVSTGASTTATVSIGQPAFGYSGSTDIAVYYDNLYGTFVFMPILDKNQILQGILRDYVGKPVRGREVTLRYPGRILHTYTDSHGAYRFFGTAPSKGTAAHLQVRGQEQIHTVQLGPARAARDLVLPASSSSK